MLRRTIPALPFHIVLLLVALFNALAGAPLHEARHIQEVVRSATALAAAGDVDALATRSAASDDHSEETHAPLRLVPDPRAGGGAGACTGAPTATAR